MTALKQIKSIVCNKKVLKNTGYYVCLYYFPVTTLIIKNVIKFL